MSDTTGSESPPPEAAGPESDAPAPPSDAGAAAGPESGTSLPLDQWLPDFDAAPEDDGVELLPAAEASTLELSAVGDPPPTTWGRPAEWRDFPLPETPGPTEAPPERRPRAWTVAVAVAVAGLLVAAVVVLVTRSSGAGPVGMAAGRTEGQTLKFISTVTVTPGSQLVSVERFAGDADLRIHAGQFTVTSPLLPDLKGTVRYLSGISYFQYSSVPLAPDKQWVELAQGDVVAAPEVGRLIGGGDPSDGLAVLAGTVGQPKRLGQEKLDGVDVTHYELRLNLTAIVAKAGAALSQFSPALAANLAAHARNANLDHVAGAVWLDAQGRVRRIDYTVDTTANGVVTHTTTDWQLSDFGETFTVAAPLADQVVALSDIRAELDRLLGSGSS